MQVTPSETLSPRLIRMTIAGGLAFWVISVATSLLPIAAEYRAAFSNWSVRSVWVASPVIGIFIAGCISYFVLRTIEKSPTKNPLAESVILSLVALALITILIDLPRSIHWADSTLHYFLIGLVFNAVRFLGLGIVIGYSLKRQRASAQPSSYSTGQGDRK